MHHASADLAGLLSELKEHVAGEVLSDQVSRLIYSTDASLYQQIPVAVVLPRHAQDIKVAVGVARKHGAPILPRGAGTSLAGQTVTTGVVIDCSRHMNRVLEVNPRERWVRVEPGVVLDNLNDFLRFYGLFFAPDVATSSRATVGGMVGNNSAGVRSVKYGRTVDHVLAAKALLSNGDEIETGAISRAELDRRCESRDQEGTIYRSVRDIVIQNRDEIQARFPKVMRRVGGYNLDSLLDFDDFNLTRLLVGSEGTLAFSSELKLHLEPIPAERMVCVLHFEKLLDAIDAVYPILKYGPSAVEILDSYGLRLARKNPAVADLCATFLEGDPETVLMVEFSGDDKSQLEASVAALKSDPIVRELCFHTFEGWSPEAQSTVWTVRKNALGVLLGMKGDAKPLPFIEDACIPVEHLSAYIAQVLALCERLGRRAAMYAHASVGVIHVRPILDLKQSEDVEIFKVISEETFQLVRKYGGSWSGEHGDGIVRAYKNREFFGSTLYECFRDLKKAFDPHGMMNPGKIIDSPAIDENLRIHPAYRTRFPETHFQFKAEQGFDRAIERCTGVGHCRKTLGGTMCPSFLATRDEHHSTRGRANALRAAIAGDLGEEGLYSRELYDVLDLCIECKACKAECPTNVDMARIKAEFLAHYTAKHGLPLGKRMVAGTRRSAELGSLAPTLSNLVTGSWLGRVVLERVAGFDRRRRLPRLARKSFSKWWKRRSAGADSNRRVVLVVDTFSNFFEPEVAQSAVLILEDLGYQVLVVEKGCCGRTAISTGQLEQASTVAQGLIHLLTPFLDQGLPIVGLEPSCVSTIRDDLPDLLSDPSAGAVGARLVSLEEFLTGEGVRDRLQGLLEPGPPEVVLHGHCQQKATFGMAGTSSLLQMLPECHVVELDAGCCGMAGAFGYEKKHYGISQKIGTLRLFPAIKKSESTTVIVAPGFSCRHQIRHFAGRQAVHPAQVIASCLSGLRATHPTEKE